MEVTAVIKIGASVGVLGAVGVLVAEDRIDVAAESYGSYGVGAESGEYLAEAASGRWLAVAADGGIEADEVVWPDLNLLQENLPVKEVFGTLRAPARPSA